MTHNGFKHTRAMFMQVGPWGDPILTKIYTFSGFYVKCTKHFDNIDESFVW